MRPSTAVRLYWCCFAARLCEGVGGRCLSRQTAASLPLDTFAAHGLVPGCATTLMCVPAACVPFDANHKLAPVFAPPGVLLLVEPRRCVAQRCPLSNSARLHAPGVPVLPHAALISRKVRSQPPVQHSPCRGALTQRIRPQGCCACRGAAAGLRALAACVHPACNARFCGTVLCCAAPPVVITHASAGLHPVWRRLRAQPPHPSVCLAHAIMVMPACWWWVSWCNNVAARSSFVGGETGFDSRARRAVGD